METQAPALPVPPLTEEQKAAAHEELCSRIPVGKRFTDEEMVAVMDPKLVLDNLRRTTEAMLAAGEENRTLKAENTRLSRLLEEERRTGGELVEANAGLGNLLGETLKTLNEAYNAGDGPAIGRLIERLQAKAGPKPAAPTCQGDCQKCGAGELSKLSDASLLQVAGDCEPGSDEHYDAIMEVCNRGLKDPEAGETACNFLPELKANMETRPRLGPTKLCGGAGVGLQGEPTLIELRADRVAFDSPEYAARIEKVNADVESLNSKNPYHIPSAKQAREMAHHIGYGTKSKDGGLQGEEEEDPIGHYETDGQPVYQSDDWVHDGDVYLRRHEAEAIVEDNMAGLQGEEGGGRG